MLTALRKANGNGTRKHSSLIIFRGQWKSKSSATIESEMSILVAGRLNESAALDRVFLPHWELYLPPRFYVLLYVCIGFAAVRSLGPRNLQRAETRVNWIMGSRVRTSLRNLSLHVSLCSVCVRILLWGNPGHHSNLCCLIAILELWNRQNSRSCSCYRPLS